MATGHIERLPSGSFRVSVYAGKDPITGQKVRLRETCASEIDALAAQARLLAQVEAETHPDRSATLEMLLRRWLEIADHELTTADNSRGIADRLLIPKLGQMKLRKLQHRSDLLDRLYKHLQRCSLACDGTPFLEHKTSREHDCQRRRCGRHVCRPLAASSIRRVHSLLSASFNYAIGWGWMDRNPAEYAHPPKLRRRRALPPEADQVARLLNLALEVSIEFGLFLWLATTTGARRGELAGLRWNKINLSHAYVLVSESYVQRAGQAQHKGTKTDEDRRLSLDALSIQMLRDYQQLRQETLVPAKLELPSEAFVFSPDPMGLRPWHPDHFSHAYRELANVLDITQPLKNLRHFNATQLLAAGVDLRTTAGRLGHGDGGATTLKVYANWMPATDQKAVDQLSADLAVLRAAQPNAPSSEAGPRLAALALPQPERPLADYLEPPVDGATTYLQVARALRQAIAQGDLPLGALMPPNLELSHWYGIAPSTANRALTALRTEGLATRRGRRWVVARPPAMKSDQKDSMRKLLTF